MKKYICRAFAVFILLAALLSMNTFAAPEYSDSVDWKKFEGQNVSINVYNWGEYISIDDGEGGVAVNAEFEALTGIKVNYTNYATNEEMYAKLKSGGASYDIIIPSDYMVSRMINEGMVQKLDFGNIPNFSKIMPDFQTSDYDPTGEYSVPYMWGIMGIVYNTKLVDPADDVETWDILWNEKYAKSILMFSNSRDAFAISCFRLGYSSNTVNEDELKEAAAELKKQKPLVQAYVMDEVFDKMGGGEAALAPYYAGDAITMIEDNPDLAFAVPREGTNIFVDAMCIPTGASNKEAAEMYINFMCETPISLANIEYVGYATLQSEVYEQLDDETKSSITYPTDEVRAKSEAYIALPNTTTKLMDQLWTEIISDTGGQMAWLIVIIIAAAVAAIVVINIKRFKKKKESK